MAPTTDLTGTLRPDVPAAVMRVTLYYGRVAEVSLLCNRFTFLRSHELIHSWDTGLAS